MLNAIIFQSHTSQRTAHIEPHRSVRSIISCDPFLTQVFCSLNPGYILKLTEDNENRRLHSVENKTPLCMCGVGVEMKPGASYLLRTGNNPQLPSQASTQSYSFFGVDCPIIHRSQGFWQSSSPGPKWPGQSGVNLVKMFQATKLFIWPSRYPKIKR